MINTVDCPVSKAVGDDERRSSLRERARSDFRSIVRAARPAFVPYLTKRDERVSCGIFTGSGAVCRDASLSFDDARKQVTLTVAIPHVRMLGLGEYQVLLRIQANVGLVRLNFDPDHRILTVAAMSALPSVTHASVVLGDLSRSLCAALSDSRLSIILGTTASTGAPGRRMP
jgi:hypothetical protein